MADTNALEIGRTKQNPPRYPHGAAHGGDIVRQRATVALVGQTAGTILLARPDAGYVFAYGMLTASVSLGSAQIKIGTLDDAAAYRAQATFTAADAPTLFGKAAAVAGGPLAKQTDVIATTTGTLPASGTLVVDLYFTKA